MIKLNIAYYKTLTGFFKTEKTDIDFLKQCFINKLNNNYEKKYTKNQVDLIIDIIKNTDFFYLSSGNLCFYITDKKIYITKPGNKFKLDIIENFNISTEKIDNIIFYDKKLDDIYTITRNKKEKQSINIDELKTMFN